jgi:hypothetical protein
MFRQIRSWIYGKCANIKPGIDIEVFGTVAVIRVDTGRMPPPKAEEHTRRVAELFTPEIKKAMGMTNLIFIATNRS